VWQSATGRRGSQVPPWVLACQPGVPGRGGLLPRSGRRLQRSSQSRRHPCPHPFIEAWTITYIRAPAPATTYGHRGSPGAPIVPLENVLGVPPSSHPSRGAYGHPHVSQIGDPLKPSSRARLPDRGLEPLTELDLRSLAQGGRPRGRAGRGPTGPDGSGRPETGAAGAAHVPGAAFPIMLTCVSWTSFRQKY
jgi:hypothetical protein